MKPLLNHPQSYPQESLTSWLWRLARTNYIDTPLLLLRYLSNQSSQSLPPLKQILVKLDDPGMFHSLAELTHSDARKIYELTLHRFACTLTLPEQEPSYLSLIADETRQVLQGRTYRDFYTTGFVWCPHCLAQMRYVRLHWHVPLLTCCITHNCWLLDDCPACQTSIREIDILNGYCEECGFVLETADTVDVPENDLLFLQTTTIMMWLYKSKSPTGQLPNVPVNVLLRVLQGLRYCIQRAGSDWHAHYMPPNIPIQDLNILKQRKLSIYERGCLYATAFHVLLDWPHNFYTFLDDYRQRSEKLEDTGLRREFGALYSSWLSRFWKLPEFDWIQNVYNEYLVERMPVYQIVYSKRAQDFPELLERIAYLDLKRIRKYLKISYLGVYRLVEEGHLTIHHFEEDVDGIWFARQEVKDLKQQWQQYIPLIDVTQQLGLSKRLVMELISAQLLKQIPSDAGVKRQSVFYIDSSSLQTLIQQLKIHTSIQSDYVTDAVLLKDVCIQHGSVKLNLVHLLSRILAGKLKAYHSNETLLPLDKMWFMRQDVEKLSELVKDEQDWMNKEDVQTYMGIRHPGLRQLIASKYLLPQKSYGNKQFFARQEVEAIHEKLIFMHEMRQVLNIAYVSIWRLMQAGLLSELPVTPNIPRFCYIFDRTAFNLWHQQYILLPEIKQLASELKIENFSRELQSLKPVVDFPKTYLRGEVMQCLSV